MAVSALLRLLLGWFGGPLVELGTLGIGVEDTGLLVHGNGVEDDALGYFLRLPAVVRTALG